MKLTSKLIDKRPDGLMDSPGSAHYRCVLSNGRKRMTFYYSHGSAICHDPILEDVLENLELDAQSPNTFEEFCSEYGYDVDSRTAERTFKATRRIAAAFNRLR